MNFAPYEGKRVFGTYFGQAFEGMLDKTRLDWQRPVRHFYVTVTFAPCDQQDPVAIKKMLRMFKDGIMIELPKELDGFGESPDGQCAIYPHPSVRLTIEERDPLMFAVKESELRETQTRLEADVKAASDALKAFPRGPMGLTPDDVKNTPEWQAAKARHTQAFDALRTFNATYAKMLRVAARAR